MWCVCRPMELFSAIAHIISSIAGPLAVFTFVSAVSRPVLFNALGVALSGLGCPHQVWWTPLMYIARAWSR
jgi:hypothetical protein